MNKLTALQNHLEFKKTSVSFEPKLKDIERYLGLFLNSSKKSLDKFTENDLISFINSLTQKYSIRTINDIKCYLKVFIKWYYDDFSIRFKNLDKLCKQQRPSKAYQPEDMLSIEEVEKLITGEQDLMYKAYWSVFFYGAFRPSECAGLKWEQIYFEPEGAIIKLHATKTNKDFYKSIPKQTEHLLKEWRKYNHSDLVFPSVVLKNQPITARGICGRLKRLSKRVLGKQVVPYAIRHSFGTINYTDPTLKKRGLDSDDVAQQMGHSKNMKQTYTNLNEEQLKAQARRLWIKTSKLKPEEREELRSEIAELKKQFEDYRKETEKGLKEIQFKSQLVVMPENINDKESYEQFLEIVNKVRNAKK